MTHTKDFHATPAILLLADGTSWRGMAVGARGTAVGELCFNTSMMGYEEMYTDPSYFGQIIVNTQPHVGNYGVCEHQAEAESSAPKIRGCIFTDCTDFFSRTRAVMSLPDYLKKHKIPAISGIDTRALVRHLRHAGSMNAILSSLTTDEESLKKALHALPNMQGLELASQVSTPTQYTTSETDSTAPKKRVAILDLGIKERLLCALRMRDVHCIVYPFDTPFETMEKATPDGYLIPNGPGDPASMPEVVENIQKILAKNRPLFGICLGHQLLARACGIGTYKLKYGHRGVNHPIKNMETGACEITSQNHGFSVDEEGVLQSKRVVMTHCHLNDGTVAGIRLKGQRAFSVQFHPEASPGPHDALYLFDKFVAML